MEEGGSKGTRTRRRRSSHGRRRSSAKGKRLPVETGSEPGPNPSSGGLALSPAPDHVPLTSLDAVTGSPQSPSDAPKPKTGKETAAEPKAGKTTLSEPKALKSPESGRKASKKAKSKIALAASHEAPQAGEVASGSDRPPQPELRPPPPLRDQLSWNPTPVHGDTITSRPFWSPAGKGSSIEDEHVRLALLSSVTAFMFILIGFAFLSRVVSEGPCSSPACQLHRAVIDANLNMSVPPCQDFYGRVCGRWEAEHGAESVRDAIYREFMTKVTTMATGVKTTEKGQTAVQKAATFYRSCTLVHTGNQNHVNEVRSMLVDFGVYWPQVTNASSILHTFLSMAAAWNWASVLQFVVQRNGHVTVRPSPYFWSVLSARQRMLENTTNQSFYRQYFDSVVAAFGRAAEEHAYTYEELIALEDNVVPGLRAALLSPEWSSLENSSLDAIVSKTRNPFSATEWESNLRSNFNFSDGSVLSISVEHTMFFVRFFSLVASEGESQMAYYVGWVVVQALSLLASSEMVTKYYVGDGVIASREHALFCANLAHVYMGVAFYADHQAREVIGSVLQDVFAVETHVQTAFRSSMKGSPFYSAVPSSMVGKEALVQSLKLVKSLNADKLNNMYKDFSDMGDNVLDNVRRAVEGRQLTEADTSLPDFVNNGSARFSFSPHRGYFKLLPIALEKPFYEPGALMVVKYATIGGEVADVFSSAAFAGSPEAFDRKLQLAFTLKSTCFFGTQVLMRHLTLEDIELVRRVTSLRVILAALMVSNQGRMRSALLAGYESWTDFELLLFFWCFVQCGSVNGRRRCNGPLAMVDQFSRVFGCKKGDSMYTGRDCSI